jgi:hypothetical protein
MTPEFAEMIKKSIDDNMMKEIEQYAEKKGLTVEGWFRAVCWDAIRAEGAVAK